MFSTVVRRRTKEKIKTSVPALILLRFIAAEQFEIKTHGHDVEDDITRRYTKPFNRSLDEDEDESENENEDVAKKRKRRGSGSRRSKKIKRSASDSELEREIESGNETAGNGRDRGTYVHSKKPMYIGLFSNVLYTKNAEIVSNALREDQMNYFKQVNGEYIVQEEEESAGGTDFESEADFASGTEFGSGTEYGSGTELGSGIDSDHQTDDSTRSKSKRKKRGKKMKLSFHEPSAGEITGRAFNTLNNGIETIPESEVPGKRLKLKLIKDSESTIKIIEGLNDGPKISERTRQYLTKHNISNSPPFQYHSTIKTDGRFVRRTIPYYHDITNSIMKLAIVRRDYSLSSRALSVLVQWQRLELRLVWTFALELLVWRRELRETESTSSSSSSSSNSRLATNNDVHTLATSIPKEDEELLEWLILNHPASKIPRATHWLRVSTAVDFYNQLILTKLRHSNPKAALERLEEIMLVPPYSDEPMIYALAGIAVMQIMTEKRLEYDENDDSNLYNYERENHMKDLGEKTHRYFEKCQQLGGVLPEDFLNYELKELEGKEEEEEED